MLALPREYVHVRHLAFSFVHFSNLFMFLCFVLVSFELSTSPKNYPQRRIGTPKVRIWSKNIRRTAPGAGRFRIILRINPFPPVPEGLSPLYPPASSKIDPRATQGRYLVASKNASFFGIDFRTSFFLSFSDFDLILSLIFDPFGLHFRWRLPETRSGHATSIFHEVCIDL